MNWEYQIVTADKANDFLAALNKLGGEGWEALSATYTIGESRMITLGQGMAPSKAAGAPMWVALVKRALDAKA